MVVRPAVGRCLDNVGGEQARVAATAAGVQAPANMHATCVALPVAATAAAA